ncbi:MAG: hypothetical protein ACLUAO_05465 [Streptococcus sp.]
MIVECDVLAILVKSYDKEDFKIYLLEAWKDLYCDFTTLFFLGNAYVKHKFHEKAVEELQIALKADKVTCNEIFGKSPSVCCH